MRSKMVGAGALGIEFGRIANMLARLVDASLVQRASTTDGESRFRLLQIGAQASRTPRIPRRQHRNLFNEGLTGAAGYATAETADFRVDDDLAIGQRQVRDAALLAA